MKKIVIFFIAFLVLLGGREVFAEEPGSAPGTCRWENNLRLSDKSCKIVEDNCNYKQGWKLPQLVYIDYPRCPMCECVKNPNYVKDTCTIPFLYNMFTRSTKGYDYCGDGKIREIYNVDPGLRDSNINSGQRCRCIDKNAEPSMDYVGDNLARKYKFWGEDPLTGTNPPIIKDINGDPIYMFCEPIDEKNPKINTAIGCIPVSVGGFISWIIPNLMGVVGGISFLIMVYGFIMIATSEGDPKKAQAAKETITAAITGLILSIFAIFLVRLIMLYVLKLPGVK